MFSMLKDKQEEKVWLLDARDRCDRCNATSALCSCDLQDPAVDPATCTFIYNAWQWYVVAAALGFIFVLVGVALVVRCCRNARTKYVEI